MINVRMEGVGRTKAKFDRAGNIVRPSITDAMWQSVFYVQSRAAAYPPSKGYPRTGRLGTSITGEVMPLGGSVVGKVGTRLSYAPGVIGRGTQWWMHAGYWHTLQGVFEEARGVIRGFFSRVPRRIVGA